MTPAELADLVAYLRRWLWWSVGYSAGKGDTDRTWDGAEDADRALSFPKTWPTNQAAAYLARWCLETIPDLRDRGAREGWRELRRRAWRYFDSDGNNGSRWAASLIAAMGEEDRPIDGAYWYRPRTEAGARLRDRILERRNRGEAA